MNYYLIHGLLIESEITLGSLKPIEKPRTQTDISIRLFQIDTQDTNQQFHLENEVSVKKSSSQDIWVNLPSIAKFHISNGNLIEINPYKNSKKQTLLLYLFGSIFATALYQRGLLVLHANAIDVNGKAILFAGHSGSGKSTTAAIFHQKGFNVLSDDVISINREGKINGGFPQIKLFQHSLNKLNINSDNLIPINEQDGKFIYPLNHLEQLDPLDITAIYMLSLAPKTNPNQFIFSPIKGMQRFNLLRENTYRNELIEGLDMQNHHLDLCSTLSDKVHMVNIIRPTSHFNAYELVDKIIYDLKSNTKISLR